MKKAVITILMALPFVLIVIISVAGMILSANPWASEVRPEMIPYTFEDDLEDAYDYPDA